jgi:hypothetical protein
MKKRDRTQDPVEEIYKELARAGHHFSASERHQARALELLDAQRARLTPDEWNQLKLALGVDDEYIVSLRRSVTQAEIEQRFA